MKTEFRKGKPVFMMKSDRKVVIKSKPGLIVRYRPEIRAGYTNISHGGIPGTNGPIIICRKYVIKLKYSSKAEKFECKY